MVMSTDGRWKLEGRLDQIQYFAFLEELVRVLQASDVNRRKRRFVRDYRPVFRSRAVQTWLASQSYLQQAPWAPESPDFMPLVPLFNEMLTSLNSVLREEILALWNSYDELGVFIHILKCESSLYVIFEPTFSRNICVVLF